MAASDDLIDFDVIENQKENIQALPSGRSAKALHQLFSPRSLGSSSTPLSQTQDLNNSIRQEYEKELLSIDESDDPLDIYDRYIKWTFDAYPSAQATPQSQLLPLLERATKAFQSSPVYKNDPRYLKIWLHYIRLFSDTPRETFAFLARHGIGESLALYYEEFAAWLESAGRWSQAEEVYRLGIEREARPAERLLRKFGEFQQRYEARPQDVPEPSSPALPLTRPALAAKVDPFSHPSPTPAQPQPPSKPAGSGSGKPKMAIFSDSSEEPPKPGASASTSGWDNIGSLAERKKENTVGARPWAGETLKSGKTNTGVPKMTIFKDESSSTSSSNHVAEENPLRSQQRTVNPKTGRCECVFVNLEAVYPSHGGPGAVEFCFEELRARHRGWLDIDWKAQSQPAHKKAKPAAASPLPLRPKALVEASPVVPVKVARSHEASRKSNDKPQLIPLKQPDDDENDENMPPSQADIDKAKKARKQRKEDRANRTRKIQVMDVREVRGETQTVHTNLDSPTKPRPKKKRPAEATMTLHTREAMDEVYDIFNQPISKQTDVQEEEVSSEESEDDDDNYTSAGESTCTGHFSGATSEFGDETTGADFTLQKDHEEESCGDEDTNSASEWSEFTMSKHVPQGEDGHGDESSGDDYTETSKGTHSEAETDSGDEGTSDEEEEDNTASPVKESPPTQRPQQISLPTRFLPVPPEGCEVPTQPYRNATQAAHNRLPFMTPIVEKTESSIGAATALAEKEYFNSKTPSRTRGSRTPAILEDDDDDDDDNEPLSSPFQDVVEQLSKDVLKKMPQPALGNGTKPRVPLGAKPKAEPIQAAQKNPIINDTQCNPVDETLRRTILSQIQPPLSSYEGYHGSDSVSGKGGEIRRFTKALAKAKATNEKTATNLFMPPTLKLAGSTRTYTIKKELGKGAFAPVYLAESVDMEETEEEEQDRPCAKMGRGEFGLKRNRLEAVKMEDDPPSAWEFYIIRQAKRRLGVSRAAESIVNAYEMHLFKDEGFLIEEYRDQGTLLNLVNIARSDINGGVMDEQLVMFFTVELLRTVEALHAKGLIHGDLKADNVLVRFEAVPAEGGWSAQYRRDGGDGWHAKGISLIDFGRGIDMKVFRPDVQFVADWKTTEQDCAEMREMRPWTYQVDYHGLAGVVHTLLFGRYLETVAAADRGPALGAGATKTYRVREPFKRYWQTDLWHALFDLLLNPLAHLAAEEGGRLPLLCGLRDCRHRFESYLEAHCEKGVGLKAAVKRMEAAVVRGGGR